MTHLLTDAERATLSHATAVMSLLGGARERGHGRVVDVNIVPSVKTIRRRSTPAPPRTAPWTASAVPLLGMDAEDAPAAATARSSWSTSCSGWGMEQFNTVWSSPQTLPTEAEIHDRQAWMRRVLA
ncbi:zinc-dependent metalloprotease [Kocuria rhizophila]|nr:zinc-dependent metalloprotease [Kocuria rhizophila]